MTETETVVALHVTLLRALSHPPLARRIMIEIGIDCRLLGRLPSLPILAHPVTAYLTKAETILEREDTTEIETETGIAGMVIFEDTIVDPHLPTTTTDQTTAEAKTANGHEGTTHIT